MRGTAVGGIDPDGHLSIGGIHSNDIRAQLESGEVFGESGGMFFGREVSGVVSGIGNTCVNTEP